MTRHRAALAALSLAVALLLGAAACSGDDGGPAAPSTTTTTAPEDDAGTTEGPGSTEPGTTAPEETTTTAAPPTAGPDDLKALLVDPGTVGEAFALDPSVGTGAFTEDLCEDVVLEVTWDEQASQALTRGTGEAQAQVTQAVLSFADPAAAEAFVQDVLDGTEACLPGGTVEEVEAGDEARWLEIDSGPTSSSVALVRSGPVVTTFDALYPTADGDPITPELLVAAARLLEG